MNKGQMLNYVKVINTLDASQGRLSVSGITRKTILPGKNRSHYQSGISFSAKQEGVEGRSAEPDNVIFGQEGRSTR